MKLRVRRMNIYSVKDADIKISKGKYKTALLEALVSTNKDKKLNKLIRQT